MAKETDVGLLDIGVLLRSPQASSSSPLLKPNALYHSGDVSQASREQNRHLRDDLKIATLLNTISAGQKRDAPPRPFDIETHAVEHVLGVTSCRVVLRNDTFALNLVNEQPIWQRLSFIVRAELSAHPTSSPNLLSEARDMANKRSVADEALAILISSVQCGLVRFIFNDLLSTSAGAFPLLVVGDVKMRDSLIILFLLLLLLGFDEAMIKHIVAQVEGNGCPANHWTEQLKRRLDAKYGGPKDYSRRAGVTEHTERMMCSALLQRGPDEKSVSLLDCYSMMWCRLHIGRDTGCCSGAQT